MTNAGWKIRFYQTDDYDTTIDVCGNYPRWGSRYGDDVITFTGLYGIGDYMLWIFEKDIGSYDFGAVRIDLSLYIDRVTVFQRQYVIRDVKWDNNQKRYILFAISEDTQILNTPLADYETLQSLSYKENRTPKEVLVEVLETNNILKVQFDEHPNKTIDFEYRQLTFNLSDKVYDFIRYIADDCGFEWFVRNKVLYIGTELHIREDMVSSTKTIPLTENISDSPFFKKVSGEARPMDICSHLEKTWRCVWAKHAFGACGGLSKGCFVMRGSGQIDKGIYYQSLEGKIERELGGKLLERNPHVYTSSYVSVGNILKDEGNNYIDQVSVQRNINTLNVRDPKDIKIDRNDGTPDTIVKHMKEQISRSTPYADKDAGIFFPSPKLTNAPPNSLIFNIDGREEASIIGGYVLGNGRNITFPVKNKGDFRLQFPGGWCFYVKENGDTYLQLLDTPTSSVPSVDNQKPHLEFKQDGSFSINFAENSNIKFENECIELNSDEDTNIKICKEEITINKNGNDTIKIDSSGNIEITVSGKVDINSSGEVTIDGTSIKLQGGGNKLSHADHTHGYQHIHQTGNMGIPIPPQTHIGTGINTDAHLPVQGTTTTEAE